MGNQGKSREIRGNQEKLGNIKGIKWKSGEIKGYSRGYYRKSREIRRDQGKSRESGEVRNQGKSREIRGNQGKSGHISFSKDFYSFNYRTHFAKCFYFTWFSIVCHDQILDVLPFIEESFDQ